MSKESSQWLNTQTLIGFTDQRGMAWHYRAEEQGDQSNHYPNAIPVEDVDARLFAWQAKSEPLYVDNQRGELVPIPDRQAIVRSDTGAVLGVFKDSYQPHQYSEWLVKQVATILDDQLGIGSAGLLKGGAVAWVQVEMPENIVTPEGVTFRPHLLACTSFDGSLATTYKRTVTNVVCDNTMAAGLREKGQDLKIKHSKYSNLRISDAREALAIVYDAADAFAREVEALVDIKVSDRDWMSFIDAHTPLIDNGMPKTGRALTMAQNERDTLTALWERDPRVAPWHGTAWGVLQAVNTYTHHEGIVRGASRSERNMLRSITGGVEDLDIATADTLTKVMALA